MSATFAIGVGIGALAAGATELPEYTEALSAGSSLDPLSADRYGVHFTADGEFRKLLEKARALISHRIPAGDLAGLMRLGLRR
ncbi:MAG TPA: hypothetical protein VHW01_13160 [Polyangiaceae bacterium]|nr:hypothetical protein [Polyangiaceae bacterium]